MQRLPAEMQEKNQKCGFFPRENGVESPIVQSYSKVHSKTLLDGERSGHGINSERKPVKQQRRLKVRQQLAMWMNLTESTVQVRDIKCE